MLSKDECIEKITRDRDGWNELREANPYWIPDLDGVDFAEADLYDVNLKNCSLVRANLENAKNLYESQLGGSNIKGAKLPHGFVFNGLKAVEEISKNSSILFITMIAGCLYCWLTIFSTKDFDLLMNSSNSQLPIINVSLSIRWFYIAGPVVLVAFYLYFQFYLKNLWKELAELPAIFPDGKTLSQKAYSWLMVDHIACFMCILKNNPKKDALRNFQNIVTNFLGWWFVPVTIIAIWVRFLVDHNLWISIYQAVFGTYAIWYAFTFHKFAKDTVSCHVVKKRAYSIFSAIIGAILILITTIAIDPNNLIFACGYSLGDQAEIAKKPLIWEKISKELNVLTSEDDIYYLLMPIKNIHFKRKNLYGLKAPRAFMVNIDLSGAQLQWAILEEAFLQRADLSSANLRLGVLDYASLKTAKLSNSTLSEADLSFADLQGAYLNNADLKDANLKYANLCGADFKNAKNLTQDALKLAIIDKTTILPANLENKKGELLKLSKENFEKLKKLDFNDRPDWAGYVKPEF